MAIANDLTVADWQREVLESEEPVIVDFWAVWCGPCRVVSPIVEEIAREKAGELKVGKVNVDQSPELARRYGIRSIPTLIVFSGGEERGRTTGARSKEDLLAEVERLAA